MMKNKSIIAKLLAEEDIFVVYKKMETAYFNPKTRELGLPIWNDELMTADIEDLMVCHEIAHALWTPLDMLEQAQSRKINHSFVNIIEDARIERMVQERYRGSVAVFNRGYRDLTEQDFFSLNDRDVSELNLIDRINLFFKKQKVEFSDEEKVWVKKVSECKTSDDVLNLAEELYKFMQDQEEEQQSNESSSEDTSESDEFDDMNSDTSSSESSEESEENLAPSNSGSADDEEKDSTDDSIQSDSNDVTNKQEPEVTTDTDTNNAIEKLIDEKASDRVYANIPSIPSEDVIIEYDKILNECRKTYSDELSSGYYTSTKKTIVDMKADSKKTVAYMVKEFEMKKSADQYARAAVSKTGSLDMNRLHTYKYNEDLFKKVTTLPGATNHGMVMVVDWSGSMYENLKGTLSQLYNLIWFCRRTQIPFEVFAFSDCRELFIDPVTGEWPNRYEMKMDDFKAGDIALRSFKLLEFFSSKMSAKEEIEMMEILWMIASYYGFEADREIAFDKVVYPRFLNLGGTPLNDAIIAMMEIVPKFKAETGVQKVNTIFLTDGASNPLDGVYDYWLDTETGEHKEVVNTLRGKVMISDPKTLKNYEVEAFNMTDGLLNVLKKRVPDMNLIGFFIAGSGRSGRVDKRTLYSLQRELSMDAIMDQVKFINKNKFLAIDSKGYDEMYVLPSKGMEVSNDVVLHFLCYFSSDVSD